MNSVRRTLEGFDPDKSYFVENEGYDRLADVRDDLETVFDYGQESEKGRMYLRRGDQLLIGLPDLADSPEDRKHLVEAAVDHYRMAARETGQNQEYLEEQLEGALRSVEAGISQREYSDRRKPKNTDDAERLEEQFMSSL